MGVDKAMKNNKSRFNALKRGTCRNNTSMYEVIANKDYNVTVLEEVYKLANDTDFSLTLRKRQRFHIEKYVNAVNKHIPSRTYKQYYEKNKGAHSLTMKGYYQRVKPLRTKTITCEICGGDYINGSSWGHIRTKRHLTALAKLSSAIAPSPQHQQKTLDNLLNSVITTCDVCGVECTKICFAEHKKSIRHLTALAKLNSGSESGPLFEQQLNQLLNAQMARCGVCGVECTKDSLPRHNKSLRHLTAVAKLHSGTESSPGYEQQLSELLNTVKVTCEVCGIMCTKEAYLQHTRTKRHRDALASLTQSNAYL